MAYLDCCIFVHRDITEAVSLFILLSTNMSVGDMSCPVREDTTEFGIDCFEIGIFYFIFTTKLAYDELTIHPEFDLGRTEFDGSSDSMERSLCLCEVISRDSERFVASLDLFSVSISNKNSKSS